jgi:restriction system protein
MLSMTPKEFEFLVASILQELSYSNISVTGGPGDLAVDISAVNPDGDKAVVQCKRYAQEHRVGSRDVQSFIGMAFQHHNAEELIFATTSTFTEPAKQLAQQHQIKLWDGYQLTQLAARTLPPTSDAEADTPAE